MRKYLKSFLFLILASSVYASSVPDERAFLAKNFKAVELRIVRYIVKNTQKYKEMYLATFKPFYKKETNFTTMAEYENAIKTVSEEYNRNVTVSTWDDFNKSEFEKIAQQYYLTKLYIGKYNRAYYLYSNNYENPRYYHTLDYLERIVYNSYQTARSLIQSISTKLYELDVLLRNKAIYSIRRSYALSQDNRHRFEQHTLGDVFKMLRVYQGKFSDFKPGIMINLAKYQTRESAGSNNGFAIILNFSPIKKQVRIDKIKTVTISVTASSGLELIKELFNSASENMVALATIERLQASLTTRQWKMARIKMQDIVASKAFVLGFKVLSTRKFERIERGKKVKYLMATVSAKIGLPKLSDIVFSRDAGTRLKKFKKMVEQNRAQSSASRQGTNASASSAATIPPTQTQPSPTPAGNTRRQPAEMSWERRQGHEHNRNDLPDIQRRERVYRSEGPQEDAWQRSD